MHTCGHCCVSWGWRIVEVFPWPRIGWIWEWRQLVELAKTLAIPRDGDDERLKRVARYLHRHPDYMQWSCRETRRSNSGVTLQLGDHLIAAWSRVQPRVAPSSGEAELYAGMRGISETVRSHDA